MGFIQINTEEQLNDAYSLIKELNPEVKRDDFFDSMKHDFAIIQKLFGLTSSGKLVSVAAVWFLITGLNEKIFWINAFITTKKMRSKGYGRRLLSELEKYAYRENFKEIRLHAHREKALVFWKTKGGFKNFSTVLHKRIE